MSYLNNWLDAAKTVIWQINVEEKLKNENFAYLYLINKGKKWKGSSFFLLYIYDWYNRIGFKRKINQFLCNILQVIYWFIRDMMDS